MPMGSYAIAEVSVDGIDALRLSTPGGLAATFAPGAGMVCCSLKHDDAELLETRGGLADYVTRRSTMGIPFLYPWGNRLGATAYEAAGKHVELDAASQVPPLRLDPNGLPIHGALAAYDGWRVTEKSADDASARLTAQLDYSGDPALAAVFPYEHAVEQSIELTSAELSITTRVIPAAGAQVPIAFGFHPYFRLPGEPAASWEIDFPVRERLLTDDRMIPTGEISDDPIAPGPLGDRHFDDGYRNVADGATFRIAGPNRAIAVTFDEGYPVAVIWRPPDGEFICVEPMTAPTNALVSGQDLRTTGAGEPFTARFSVRVD
jgi:galactose mutarotase-like enzyme